MRVLRDHRHCVCVQHTYAPTAQHSSVATVARVQQLWNEWEIQGLVLVSFSLQVFLLFSAGFRKRYCSRALRVLLWLAYLSADSVAIFVLGRLTLLLGDDPHHQLVLFWVPFLLLHLGGQDTITAFSIEDCTLWKRHLLNLTTQVAMAIYVVGKQWRWDKKLVAPMVLMFISGTTKYAERAWALWRAGSMELGSRELDLSELKEVEIQELSDTEKKCYNKTEDLPLIFSSEEKNGNPGSIVEAVAGTVPFRSSIEFIMDVTPRKDYYLSTGKKEAIKKILDRFRQSPDNGADLAYKLCEIRLSLIYDYLYTKFGSLNGVLHRLTTLVLTSSALAAFVVAMAYSKGSNRSYSGVDVWISYVLLVGALALEISSILMWLMSSYWPYMTVFPREAPEIRCGARRTLLSILKRLRPRPQSRVEWSGKLHQYSLIHECIHDKMARPVNFLAYMTKQGYTAKHVVVSPEVKKVLFDKLCEIATSQDSKEKLAFSSSFRGEWAAGWAASSSSSSNAAQKALVSSNIQNIDLVSSALLWHLVTEICLAMSEEMTTVSCRFRTCSQQLSKYVMYLLAHCKVMLDNDGRNTLQIYRHRLRKVHGEDLVQALRSHVQYHLCPIELFWLYGLQADKWELIAMVWVEMLCYIARNCGPEFHAKQLSAGGEFLTHAKLLISDCLNVNFMVPRPSTSPREIAGQI